jgi:hypothetical protein
VHTSKTTLARCPEVVDWMHLGAICVRVWCRGRRGNKKKIMWRVVVVVVVRVVAGVAVLLHTRQTLDLTMVRVAFDNLRCDYSLSCGRGPVHDRAAGNAIWLLLLLLLLDLV